MASDTPPTGSANAASSIACSRDVRKRCATGDELGRFIRARRVAAAVKSLRLESAARRGRVLATSRLFPRQVVAHFLFTSASAGDVGVLPPRDGGANAQPAATRSAGVTSLLSGEDALRHLGLRAEPAGSAGGEDRPVSSRHAALMGHLLRSAGVLGGGFERLAMRSLRLRLTAISAAFDLFAHLGSGRVLSAGVGTLRCGSRTRSSRDC